ncbi:AMP-binding protein [Peptococcaceae bacterium 1198_IL3148]
MEITPLDSWIQKKIGCSELTREAINHYQLKQLNQTIALAREKSNYYRQKLNQLNTFPLKQLSDITNLPITPSDDLKRNPYDFLCVSQSEISRVVSLQSSGTTGTSKRIYFTAADQQLTIDFFHHGMSTLVAPGDRVLIMLPGERPGSVGDLLKKALARFEVTAVLHGPLQDVNGTLEILHRESINSIVGIPVQVLALARSSEIMQPLQLKSVLLSTDYVPATIVQELQRIWQCQVYNHYGMTEMGLGGGVECAARNGYHLREADLYFEIIDPDSGQPVAPGEVGEVAFTTLTRVGMPLIRYATGDMARFIPERCPCGSVLLRMGKVTGRLTNVVTLAPNQQLTMSQLDEIIFTIKEIVDFRVNITAAGEVTKLNLEVKTLPGSNVQRTKGLIRELLLKVTPVANAIASGTLQLGTVNFIETNWISNGTIKRTFNDLREGDK